MTAIQESQQAFSRRIGSGNQASSDSTRRGFEITPFGRRPGERLYDRTLDKNWPLKHTPFNYYFGDYLRYDPTGELRQRIEDVVTGLKKRDLPVIVDLMASTDALRELGVEYFEGRKIQGVSVCYTDQRDNMDRNIDALYGIQLLEGDLNWTATWNELKACLSGKKANLIMEQGYGGLRHIPTRASYYRAVLPRMWDMLDNDGQLLLQTPPKAALEQNGVSVTNWLADTRSAGIDTFFVPSYISRDCKQEYGILFLGKNNVDKLPLIAKPYAYQKGGVNYERSR